MLRMDCATRLKTYAPYQRDTPRSPAIPRDTQRYPSKFTCDTLLDEGPLVDERLLMLKGECVMEGK